jgi:hypothetical protein
VLRSDVLYFEDIVWRSDVIYLEDMVWMNDVLYLEDMCRGVMCSTWRICVEE